ncbi:hypothetical protein ACQR5W_18630 [Xanthomonas sacchari]|uniref:hypothetical protein n=1 Tax=Xanthomonas sp. SHU 308 TaxID=1591201 RepID=UPI001E3C7B3E|nr:hypothetical protein [Xanthomonas sp. SHU 308]
MGLIAFPLAGCANVSVSEVVAAGARDAVCTQARDWDGGGSLPAQQITPTITGNEMGVTYHFDLRGTGGLRSLDASCGPGSYAECNFTAHRLDGTAYQFSELSTFGLWQVQGRLYLLYRIVSPESDAAARKRRLVELAESPVEICNQIGDYSDLM